MDNTLGIGESVTFLLTFTDTDPVLGSNLYVDNIAIVVVPEPATLGMFVVAGLGIVVARRIWM